MSSFVSKFNHSAGKYFLIGIDLSFIAISLMRFRSGISGGDDPLSIAHDGGYAEYFQYLKFGAIILILTFAAQAKKSALMAGWAIVFAILLIDDKVSIHERLGSKLASWLSLKPMFSLRAVDYGEILVYLLWAAISIAVLTTASRIDMSLLGRQASKKLLILLGGLVFFGGFIDMLSIVVSNLADLSAFAKRAFDALEDGGEMIVVSLMLWFVYQTYLQVRRQTRQAASGATAAAMQTRRAPNYVAAKAAASTPYAGTKTQTALIDRDAPSSESGPKTPS